MDFIINPQTPAMQGNTSYNKPPRSSFNASRSQDGFEGSIFRIS